MAQKMALHVISLLPTRIRPLQRGITSSAPTAFFAYPCGIYRTVL